MVERLKPKSQNLSSEDLLNMVDQRVLQITQQMVAPESNDVTPNQPFGSGQGYPQTLTQENINFLDGNLDVPERIRQKFWGIVTIQNQLSQVNSVFEQRRIEAGSRMALQAFSWEGETNPAEIAQLEVYVRLQQLKSRGGIERRLLAPQLTEQVRKETILEEARERKGLIGGLLGR